MKLEVPIGPGQTQHLHIHKDHQRSKITIAYRYHLDRDRHLIWLTPTEARKLADLLHDHADRLETKENK